MFYLGAILQRHYYYLTLQANTYDPATLATRDTHDGVCWFVNRNCWAASGSTTFYANAGYYRELVSSRCIECPAGAFSSAADGGLQTACAQCANGYTPSTATASALGCRCNAGYFSGALFPAFLSPQLAGNNNTTCVVCPPSSYFCTGGALPPTPCPSFSRTFSSA